MEDEGPTLRELKSYPFRTTRLQIFFKTGTAFLKIWQITWRKHLCWSLFLIKLQAWRSATLLKRHSDTGVFLWNSQEHLSLRNSSGGCFYPFIYGCISTFCWICFMLNWFLGADFCNTSTLACITVVSLNIEKPEVFARRCS